MSILASIATGARTFVRSVSFLRDVQFSLEVLRQAKSRVQSMLTSTPSPVPTSPYAERADAYAVASNLYGADVFEHRESGATSFDEYAKRVIGQVVMNHMGGGGVMKKFLFRVIDVMPLFVTPEYMKTYPELIEKYRSAPSKKAAIHIKQQMKKIRSRMLDAQPIRFRRKTVERDGSTLEQSRVQMVLSRHQFEVEYGQGEASDEPLYLKVKGAARTLRISIPRVSVRTVEGEKITLRSLVARTTETYPFLLGRAVRLEFVVHEREVNSSNP